MAEIKQKQRVCIIGAGPSGLSCLYQFRQLAKQGKDIPDIVCYEKQSENGGMWNFTWRTGLDEYCEPIHGSMYKNMWINGPKEAVLEYPDYTYQEHFGKPIPSFTPRAVILDYLRARFKKENVDNFINFNTVVRNVIYDEENDNFKVFVKDLKEDKNLDTETFNYVFVATGHFSFPNVPSFDGIGSFLGRILHSHDFRDAREFSNQRVLIIGSSYSADDIAIHCYKYGAKHVIISWRTKPTGLIFPEGIEERQIVTDINGNMIHFKDGTKAEVDVIIQCTGYIYHFPFMPDDLRLKSENTMYPVNLYKGVLWMKGGNNRVFYFGMQNLLFAFNMFDLQAEWACLVVTGEKTLPDMTSMQLDHDNYVHELVKIIDNHSAADYQKDYVLDLCRETNRQDFATGGAKIVHDVFRNRDANIQTWRNYNYQSLFTGKMASEQKLPWMEAMDDDAEEFLKE